jgi:hypothetical protein
MLLTALSNTAFILFMAQCSTDSCVETAEVMAIVAEQEECYGMSRILNTYADPTAEYWFCMEVFLGSETELMMFSDYLNIP